MGIGLSDMVLIPGGEFAMGSERGYENERPVHVVECSSFLLDRRVVTNLEYVAFLEDNPKWRKGCAAPDMVDKNYLNLWPDGTCPPELLDHSVINVSAFAADAFAAWAVKRLPTEAEWEYAAGGPNRLLYSIAAQYEAGNHVVELDGSQPRGAVPSRTPPNAFGLYDMCGLGWEWLQDSYEHGWYADSPRKNPVNQAPTGRRVLRGGAVYSGDLFYLRIHVRGSNLPTACNEDYGLRCAKDS